MRARSPSRTGDARGGRFTGDWAAVAHIWHGVISRFRPGTGGFTVRNAAPLHHDHRRSGRTRTCGLRRVKAVLWPVELLIDAHSQKDSNPLREIRNLSCFPLHHGSLSTRGTSRTCPSAMSRRCSSAELRGRDANGTRTRTSHLDGVVHYSGFAMAPLSLRSGGWGRTSVNGLTVRRPAIERHQTVDCRALPSFRPWRATGLRGGGGIRTRVTGLMRPGWHLTPVHSAVTHPGLEPGRSCLKGRWL